MRGFSRLAVRTGKRLKYRAKPTRTVLRVEVLEGRLMLHGDGDDPFAPDVPLLPVDLQALLDLEAAAPGEVNVSPFPQTTYSTLANGMPILNSLPNAPAAIYIDFDGGVYHGSTTVDPYDVDGNSATFNTTEQETIAEAWREMSVYFAMFNVNVTTVQPNKPVAWLLVGNNISGGQSYVNVFPDSRPESRNQSSDARTRVSGLAHEIGHNFGNQHTANYDNLGNKTSEYHGAFDPLHGPIMGIDYAGIIHKWTTWHNRNGATVLQDDMAVITADLDNYGGDGYRTDDFGGSIATAAALTTIGTTQASVGIIERLTDVDMFSFASVGGTYSILVGRDNPSGVDVKVSVLDATGAVLAQEDGDPRSVPYTMVNDSHMTLALPAGTFYVKVESHGNYGDQGQYVVRVDPLAAGWQAEDVGLNGVPGYSSYDASTGTYSVAGSGTDIAGTADGFQYLYQSLDGNGSITVRVDSLENTSSGAKAGIMIRESLAENARNVSLVITPTSGVQWTSRSSTGGGTSSTTVGGSFTPTWLRITRAGNIFTAQKSTDGVVWTQVGSPRTVLMGTTVSIGQVASAKNNIRLTTAILSNVSLTGAVDAPDVLNALPAPVDLVASSVTSNSVALAWSALSIPGDTNGDAAVTLADYINVRDNFGGSGLGDANGDGVVDAVDFRLVKDNFGTNVQNYRVERSSDGINFVQVGTTTPGVTTFTNTGLSDFQRYTYRVLAVNSSGISPPSSDVSVTTHAGAVSNLNIISYSSSQLIPDWSDASGEANYRVERSADGVTGWVTRATTAKNVPTINDSSLVPNTKYYCRVVTLEVGNVVSATSSVVSAYTRLATVTGLKFLSQAANQLVLGWNAVSGATTYLVERSLDDVTYSTIISNLAVTGFTDNSVAAATKYYYRVTGINANTRGVASNDISTTTPAAGAAAAAAVAAAASASGAASASAEAAGPGPDILGRLNGTRAGSAAPRLGDYVAAGRGHGDDRQGHDNQLQDDHGQEGADRSLRFVGAQSPPPVTPTLVAVDNTLANDDSLGRHASRLSDSLLQSIAGHRRKPEAREVDRSFSSKPTWVSV
jgi:fibronectin type 3 domain-containing protein